MFRFAYDKDTPVAANAKELATAGITEDRDWGERLDERDETLANERYYRVENETPDSVAEAVSYVQGIMMHPPERVWIEGEPHIVGDDDVGSASKPHV